MKNKLYAESPKKVLVVGCPSLIKEFFGAPYLVSIVGMDIRYLDEAFSPIFNKDKSKAVYQAFTVPMTRNFSKNLFENMSGVILLTSEDKNLEDSWKKQLNQMKIPILTEINFSNPDVKNSLSR